MLCFYCVCWVGFSIYIILFYFVVLDAQKREKYGRSKRKHLHCMQWLGSGQQRTANRIVSIIWERYIMGWNVMAALVSKARTQKTARSYAIIYDENFFILSVKSFGLFVRSSCFLFLIPFIALSFRKSSWTYQLIDWLYAAKRKLSVYSVYLRVGRWLKAI